MKHLLKFLAISGALFVLAGCSGGTQPIEEGSERVTSIVATTPVVADFSRIVGSDFVDVYEVVPPGVDPHYYEPTPADLQALAQADLIVRNGVGLESWFDRTIKASGTKAKVVDTSQGVTIRRTSAGSDPHIWHSPVNAKIMVSNISRALQEVDPANAAGYSATERAYGAQLDGLGRDIRKSIASLNDKRLVTNHDSLGYYADEFGLTIVTTVVPTFDSQAEVSSAQVQALIEQLKTADVKAIFVEATVNDDVARSVAEGAEVNIVSGEGSIFGDTLGEEGSSATTYLEMERHNTNVIVNNLR